MKKFFAAILFALLMTLPCQSQAGDTGIYIAPKLVAGFQNTDWSLSTPTSSGSADSTRGIAGFSVAGGYDFSIMHGLPLRAELEYGYNSRVSKSVSDATGKSRIQTLMANAYWDITNIMDFTPYVGAGIGLAAIHTKGTLDEGEQHYSASDTDYSLAAQVGVGCSYFFTPNISADFGYRYLFTGDGETGVSGYNLKAESLAMHQFFLGMRLTF